MTNNPDNASPRREQMQWDSNPFTQGNPWPILFINLEVITSAGVAIAKASRATGLSPEKLADILVGYAEMVLEDWKKGVEREES